METQRAVTDGTAPPPSATMAEFQLLPLGTIRESISNPRRHFDEAKAIELEASVREKGILVPIKVRPADQGYEIVYGARRFRAAQAAGLAVVPSLVQVLTDQQVLEEQVVENLQRSDVHPLEEADGYHDLMEKYGYGAEDLAAKVGKSKAYIYARLKLRELGEVGRKAFFEGGLTPSVALLVARIPSAKLQAEATKVLSEEQVTYRAAVDLVQRSYMLQLRDAPFDTGDADLVASAGACTTCPKRSGNQAELFADVKSPDVCTDPGCYRVKVDALWKLKIAEAKETGQEVLDEKKAKKLFQYGHLDYTAGFKDLDDQEYVDGRMKKVRTIIGKDVQPVLARDPQGRIRELVKSDVVQKALREKTPRRKADAGGDREERRKETEKYERDNKLRAARAFALMREVIAKLETHSSKAVWFILAEALVDERFMYGAGEDEEIITHRLGHPPRSDYEKDHADLLALVAKMKQEELAAFVFEMTLHQVEAFHKLVRGEKGPISELASVLGIDEKKVTERVKKELAEKDQVAQAKPASPPAAPPKKKAAAAKKKAPAKASAKRPAKKAGGAK